MAIQIRRGTAAAWTSANPTLASGEPGFETDTGLLFIGDGATAKNSLTGYAMGKQTLWVPRSQMIAATTSGPAAAQLETATNKQNYLVYDFDGAADEFAHFQVAFPKSWDEGTITYQVFWSSTGTDTDAVVWGLQGYAVSDNEAIEQVWGTAVLVTDNLQSAAGELYVSAESSAVTIGGTPAAGDLVFFRFYRDADNVLDTASEDARLVGLKLFFTTNAHNDV
jgi:hypothetical protein